MALYCKGVARHSNNPFNIKYDGKQKWIGQIGQYKGFVHFQSQGYGIRAGVKLLYRYVFSYGLVNVDDIVAKYCPRTVDGNSATFDDYVKFVCKFVGVRDIRTRDGFLALCSAISTYECSINIPRSQFYFIFDMLNLKFI